MTKRPLWPTLRRSLHWHRRSIAAVATFVAVLAAITALQPDRPPQRSVVVAARAIAAGTTLSAADVSVAIIPESLAPPDAAASFDDVVGRAVNAPVSERSVLTASTIASGQVLARPGFVVAALPLTNDALLELLRPGSVIDILAPQREAGGVLASGVRVVAAPGKPEGGLGFAAASRVALVEVTPAVALELARTGLSGGVTIVVH